MSRARVFWLDRIDKRNFLLLSAVSLFAMTGFAVAASGWDEFQAGRRMRAALRACDAGRFLEASALARKALALKPEYAAPWLLLRRIQTLSGEDRTPLPPAPSALLARGVEDAARLEETIAAEDEALEARLKETSALDPAAPEPHLNLAACWARRGDLDRVEEFLRRALFDRETRPPGLSASVTGFLGWSLLHERRLNLDEARAGLLRAKWLLGREGAADVDRRLARLTLLAKSYPFTLTREDAAAAEALLKSGGSGPVAARLANLLAVAEARLPRDEGTPDAPLSERVSARLDRAEKLLAGAPDLAISLNRVALALAPPSPAAAARAPAPRVREEAARLRAAYLALGPDLPARLPRGAAAVVEHNLALLDHLTGGVSLERAVQTFSALAARGPGQAVTQRNLGVLCDRAGLSGRAAACYRRAQAIDSEAHADLSARVAALEAGR